MNIPTDKQLLKQDREINRINRSRRYKDMEDDGGTCRGETISMHLIQQFPQHKELLYDYFG